MSNPPGITRADLARFITDQRTLRAFELLIQNVGTVSQSDITNLQTQINAINTALASLSASLLTIQQSLLDEIANNDTAQLVMIAQRDVFHQ